MPALQPPSMQIGGLPNGAASVSPLPPGPPLGEPWQYAAPRIVQQVVAVSTGAVQPASFTATIAATGAGNLLLAFFGGLAQGGAQNTAVPTGWQAVANSGLAVGTSIAGKWAFLPACAAGITSVVWSALTNYSSCGAVIYEVAGVSSSPVFLKSGIAGSASSTSQAAFAAYTPNAVNILGFGAVLCTSTATTGSTSTPPTWNGVGQQTSTNTQVSAVNTNINGFSFSGPAPTIVAGWQFVGTASIAAALISQAVILLSLASMQQAAAPSRAFVADVGGGAYGVGDTGSPGWSLGGTKPGGAGSGQ